MRRRTAPDDLTLRHLLAAAGEGDGVALEALVTATQATVWRVCTALGSRGEEADLVQETYLRAMRTLHLYRGDAPVSIWFATIARNVCADDVRRRQRRRRLADQVAALSFEGHVAEPQIVDDLVDQLTDDRRHAFVLTQCVGLSYEEAAQVLGCPIGTIRSRVSRARADLEALLRRAAAG